MKTEWFKDLNPEDVDKFKKSLESCQFALDKLAEICYNKARALEKTTLEDYDSPSWSQKQAHINGMRQAYINVAELCILKKER